jgi:HK97 gp10 family phage protein
MEFLEHDMDYWVGLLKKYQRSLTRNELLRITRKSIKPVLVQAKNEVARIERTSREGNTTGNLWESLGNITGRSKEFVNVQIGARAKRGFKGWHAHLLEFGTSRRSTKRGANRGAAKPRPFMKPAFDKTFPAVKATFENNVAQYAQKQADKIIR